MQPSLRTSPTREMRNPSTTTGYRLEICGSVENFNNQLSLLKVELDLNSEGIIDKPRSNSGSFTLARIESSAADRDTDRPEWAHLHYQRRRRRCHAAAGSSTFEMGLHWSVATGACLAEMAQGWARKAAQCGFSLVPIPGEHGMFFSSYGSELHECRFVHIFETKVKLA